MAGGISQQRKLHLFREILRIRLFEERIIALYPEQEMRCPVHLSIGQEAVAVGVCAALQKTDVVMSGHRAHGHYLAKGGNMKKMLAEIYGKATGCCGGRGGSMHLVDLSVNFYGSTPVVGGTIPIATGVAWAEKMKGGDRVSVIFLGEGATEEGVWHESINFASVHKLPLLFVCENNLYSVYTPLNKRQPKRPLTALAKTHGALVDSGNGNDVEEVYIKTQKMLEKMKKNGGPGFIEFSTYRFREHCGVDFDNKLGYRTEAEYTRWLKKDPIPAYKEKLLKNKYISLTTLKHLQNTVEKEVDEAVAFAKSSPYPTKESLSIPGVFA